MPPEKKQYTVDDNVRSMTFTLKKIETLLQKLVQIMDSQTKSEPF